MNVRLSQLSHGTVASILIATFSFVLPLPQQQAVAQTQTAAQIMAPYMAKIPATVVNNLKTAVSTYVTKANSGTPSQQLVTNLVSALTTYVGVLNDVGAITAGNKFLAANPTALRDYTVPASQLSTITAQMKAFGMPTVNESVLAQQMNPTQAQREAAYTQLEQLGLGGVLNQVVKAVAGVTQSQVKVAPLGELTVPHLTLASYHPLPKLHAFELKGGPLTSCNVILAFGITAGLFDFGIITAICAISWAIYCD
jgi:hypothetical protein